MWILIGIIILICVGCFCVYRTAEVHELHTMRAAFENKKHTIESFINDNKNNDIDFNKSYYEGEIEELEELKNIIDQRIKELSIFDLEK